MKLVVRTVGKMWSNSSDERRDEGGELTVVDGILHVSVSTTSMPSLAFEVGLI